MDGGTLQGWIQFNFKRSSTSWTIFRMVQWATPAVLGGHHFGDPWPRQCQAGNPNLCDTPTHVVLSRASVCVGLPVSAFADDLHLKVVNPTGCWDWVGGPHWRRIFGGFTVTFRLAGRTHAHTQGKQQFTTSSCVFSIRLSNSVLMTVWQKTWRRSN